MQIGMVGLGRMGSNMVRRLMRGGHDCVVFDLKPTAVEQLQSEGATAVSSIEKLIEHLEAPPESLDHGSSGRADRGGDRRIVWSNEPG